MTKARSHRRPSNNLPARLAKAERALARLKEHGRMVETVMRRAGGWCELCGGPVQPDYPLVIHRLNMGSPKTKNERVENVMAVHASPCHEAFHQCVSHFAPAVRAWCERHGYPLPKMKEIRQ